MNVFEKNSFVLIFFFLGGIIWSQNLSLKSLGNITDGFTVGIYNNKELLLNNTEEFNLRLANTDLSERIAMPGWTGAKHTGDAKNITLTRESFIPALDLNLTVTVNYQIINEHAVKKTIDLFQSGMPSLYYILEETAKPAKTPLKYLTFEYDNFPGGFVHEIYPSAGFVTNDNQVVGFLTDAGYKNHYTRTTRRRFNGHGGGFVGMRKLPDPALVSVSTEEERKNGQQFIKQTFGEMWNLDTGTVKEIEIDSPAKNVGDVTVKQNETTVINFSSDKRSGLERIVPLKDQKVYTIFFLAKGNAAVALKLFRVKNGIKTVELEHGIKYIDKFPVNETNWTLFKGSILVPYIEKDSVSMFIGSSDSKDCTLELKDFKIEEHQPESQPYNVMKMGQMATKTTYMFIEPWANHRDFVISSQTRLAEAKGFKGSQIEKMLYANFNMLTWITAIDDFSPFNVPNMNYAPDMYNRDSFFSTVASYNKELNLEIWNRWAETQTERGAIATIITPYMGTIEAKDNEATIHFLIWAMMNKRRFGAVLPKDKIDKAVQFVLNEFDEDKDGICMSHFTLSQVDINRYDPKMSRLAVNQGMLVVALRTIKELGYDISDSYIDKAEKEYQNFYDPERGHLMFDKNFPDIITFTDLEPEFFSLWLFNKPMLSDAVVQSQLDNLPALNKMPNAPYPELGTTGPVCMRNTKQGNVYLNKDYQPFAEFGLENYGDGTNDGLYYNGGSWMRPEYCAYAVGARHGWKNAKKMMENRAWAEINLKPEWPYSKEFIPTKNPTSPDAVWWPSTRGLCWNVFILMADEVAGLRTPEMDPDYVKIENQKNKI